MSLKHEAAEQGDEADEAGASDGASQLIPGVRRTNGGQLPARLLATGSEAAS